MDDAVKPVGASPVENQAAPAKRRRGAQAQYPDRIKVSAEAVQRLAGWSEQIGGRLRGVKFTRSDLVNFIILTHPEALTTAELKEMGARYFDEEKFVLWAIGERKAAKARGENVTLTEIMEQNWPEGLVPTRTRARKSESSRNSENTDRNSQKQPRSPSHESLNSVENPAES